MTPRTKKLRPLSSAGAKVEAPFLYRSTEESRLPSDELLVGPMQRSDPTKASKTLVETIFWTTVRLIPKIRLDPELFRQLRLVLRPYALGPSALGEEKMRDFPEISQKFEGLGLELVSRNLTLSQKKSVPRVRCGLMGSPSQRTSWTPPQACRWKLRTVTPRPQHVRVA